MTICRIAPLACLALAACGGGEPPARSAAPEARQETVFDDMVDKKREIPAAVEAAQQQRVDETRKALEAAERGDAPGAEPGR